MRRRKQKVDKPAFRDFILADLRVAHVKARMLVAEIETIGIGLRGGFIEPAEAVGHLKAAGALDFLSEAESWSGYTLTETAVLREAAPPVFLAPRHWPESVWAHCLVDRIPCST